MKNQNSNKNKNMNNKNINKNNTNFDYTKPYGIYDLKGENLNPLTLKPYSEEYSPLVSKVYPELLTYIDKDEILKTIKENQIILLKAGTGVGKTVILPKIALHAFDYKGKVVCTIPKKLIAKSSAEFSAKTLDVKVGEEVGYFYAGENKTSSKSKLIFATPGSIISKPTHSDPYLSEYDCILIDEAHERSLQTDLILLLLKKAALVNRNLKIVIMSATINLDLFRNYFPKSQFKFGEFDAGEKTLFKIEDYYLDKPLQDWKEGAINQAVELLKHKDTGDILIFVTAKGDGNYICNGIHQKIASLNTNINPFCISLYSGVNKEEEQYATDPIKYKQHPTCLEKECTRKIVCSTNVAESSLTVDGIVYVIDSGIANVDGYNPKTNARSLMIEHVSKKVQLNKEEDVLDV